ncbi:MAG: hypothetical protein M3367_01950 [Acidobacteriota bacterium]|nr:hypothetical protein [Acidobacteriota bacterium]
MGNYTDIEPQVECGLEKIDPNRRIEVSLKDFLYLHNTIAEFVRFFHQPRHYKTLEDIEKFLGNKDRGGFHLLSEILDKKFNYQDVFPKDIQGMINNSEFEHPDYPYYYKP